MTTTKRSPSRKSLPASPSIDAVQAMWVARELDSIIAKLGADSPVALVLRHARREVASLRTAAADAGTIVGPFRVAA